MTAAGALPPRRSVYTPPAVPPGEMTPQQTEQYQVAQIAGIVAAAGLAKSNVADATTIALLPYLRAMDPFNAVEVAAFALKAAEFVEAGRQQVAQITWGAVQTRLAVLEVPFNPSFREVAPSRTTRLDEAYKRPAGAYRKRIAGGVEGIKNLIDQAEAERFEALGGNALETGESDAEVKGKKNAQGKSGDSQQSAKKSGAGSVRKGVSGGSGGAGKVGTDRPVPANKPVRPADETVDDWSPDSDERAEAALDAESDRLQEIRDQAELAEEEKQELLERQAQQDMEIRMERMVNDDIGMAARDAHRDALKSTPAKVIGYRRVLHPELAKYGKSCGLCVAASTRIYKKSELMPMHNLCNCEPVEVIDGLDAGDQINLEDLSTIYEEAGMTTDGRTLKAEKYVVFQHPELGPVLRNEKHAKQDIGYSQREASDSHKKKTKAAQDAYYRQKAESFGTTKTKTGRAKNG